MPQMATNELTASPIDRQNILNNSYALLEIAQATQVKGIEFEGAVWFTKEQLAQFFEVEPRTIERYLANNQAELQRNGYVVLRGERLKRLRSEAVLNFGADIHVGTKVARLGVFDLRAFLNIGMLLEGSERAKSLRLK